MCLRRYAFLLQAAYHHETCVFSNLENLRSRHENTHCILLIFQPVLIHYSPQCTISVHKTTLSLPTKKQNQQNRRKIEGNFHYRCHSWKHDPCPLPLKTTHQISAFNSNFTRSFNLKEQTETATEQGNTHIYRYSLAKKYI